MELLGAFLDIVLHLDAHLQALIQNYGAWVYLILFVVVFCETGLVVTPFLPGDSLLFAAGTFAALGDMRLSAVFLVLAAAAILGDTVNCWIGKYLGPRLTREGSRLLKKEHLDRTHAFF